MRNKNLFPDFHMVGTHTIDTQPLLDQISRHPEVFGIRSFRNAPVGEIQSPHRDTQDCWIRYRPYHKVDRETLHDAHEEIWYPEALKVPASIDMSVKIAHLVGAERLGGVLLIRIPAGAKVYPHIDSGWNMEYYQKFLVPLNDVDAVYSWESGDFRPKVGEIWEFENDVVHWAQNNSDRDGYILAVAALSLKRSLIRTYPELVDVPAIDKEFHMSETVCAAEMEVPQGIEVGKHVHSYSHLSILTAGKAIVTKFHTLEDSEPFETIELDATSKPQTLDVQAGVYHNILALTDVRWFCIHPRQT